MADRLEKVERCSGCGLAIAGGERACQAILDELLARDFSDARYFRAHRMLVDTYCLQHPDRYCVSAKSLAAHLTGLCWLIEHAGDRAIGHEPLRRWLEVAPPLERPELPEFRGWLTVADVRGASDPESHMREVERWARATWEAYASLHPLAREWIAQAQASPRKR